MPCIGSTQRSRTSASAASEVVSTLALTSHTKAQRNVVSSNTTAATASSAKPSATA
jgi:hypothetical protein